MVLSLSLDTSGPDPAVHEILQIGVVLTTDDFKEEISRFGAWVRPSSPQAADLDYLKAVGIESPEQLLRRMPFWETPDMVFASLERMILRGSNTPGDTMESIISRSRIVALNAPIEVPFLVRALLKSNKILTYSLTNSVSSLYALTLDYLTTLSYLGMDREVSLDPASVFDFYGISCRNLRDAVERASCIASCYRKYHEKLSTILESGPRRRSPRGKPGGGRRHKGPIIRRADE